MIHIILRKKLSCFVLAFFLFAIVCVWKEMKKGSYYDSLKWETEGIPAGDGSGENGHGVWSTVKSQHPAPPQEQPGPQLHQGLSQGQATALLPGVEQGQLFQKPPLQVAEYQENYLNMNKYKVSYKGPGPGVKLSAEALRCHLRNHVNVSMVESIDFPFNTSEWEGYLPKENIRTKAGPWGKCAVVSSAGSLKSSQLGREIDDHDAVLRFNAAPTANFQQDVGTKTTIRLINSQLVTIEGRFLKDSLYNEGILIVWDPSVYHSDIPEWYQHPDYSFFNNYKSYRKMHPNQPFYILRPQMPWELWDILQEISPEEIQPNPPSSGMLGIMIMMTLCDQVDIYEFLPSKRKTDICYYYQKFFDIACTMGAYHPLLFEKNMVKHLNQGADEDIYLHGKATLPGFRSTHC